MGGEATSIHGWVRSSREEGWAWTACGKLHPEGMTTRDRREVTCDHLGCREWVEQHQGCARCEGAVVAHHIEGKPLCAACYEAWRRSPEVAQLRRTYAAKVSDAFLGFLMRRTT